MQIECTDAINQLYNFKFAGAEKEFRYMRYRYPAHPLPYFLLGLSEWWKIFPELEEKSSDAEPFLAYMDTSIELAEKIYDKDNKNAEALFFLAAAYGFKGRYYSEHESWTKATFAAKNAISYMNEARKFADLSPEFMFGEALYNYYREWIPENYFMLKPVVAMFPKGDKKKGLELLKDVANNAFYTRVEAQTFVVRIYSNEENDPKSAYLTAKLLADYYPENPYFLRYYARTTYLTSRWNETEPACKELIKRVEAKQQGYGVTTARYAYFFLGYIYHVRYRNYPDALKMYEKAIEYGMMSSQKESGYITMSMLQSARIYEKQKDTKNARKYYQMFLDYADRQEYNESIKEARKYLRKNKG